MASFDEVKATELEVEPEDVQQGITAVTLIQAGRATFVLMDTVEDLIAIGIHVSPPARKPNIVDKARARSNAYRQLKAMRVKAAAVVAAE